MRRHGLPRVDPAQRGRLDGKPNRDIFPILLGRPLDEATFLAHEEEKESLYRELSRGRLVVVDGGHTKTVHFHQRLGRATFIKGPNVPLGWLADETYQQVSVALEPGDVLLFYSDGMSEASNGDGEQFGGARVAEFVAASHALSAPQLLERLRSELVQFCGRETFADDLNCVAVKIDPLDGQMPGGWAQLQLQSRMSELARARRFVRQFCLADSGTGMTVPQACCDQLELAVHETLTNVIEHAYHNRADQSITLELRRRAPEIVVHIQHDGETFRPEVVPAPKVEDFAQRGYGLYIIDQCVDQIEYSRAASGRQWQMSSACRQVSPRASALVLEYGSAERSAPDTNQALDEPASKWRAPSNRWRCTTTGSRKAACSELASRLHRAGQT